MKLSLFFFILVLLLFRIFKILWVNLMLRIIIRILNRNLFRFWILISLAIVMAKFIIYLWFKCLSMFNFDWLFVIRFLKGVNWNGLRMKVSLNFCNLEKWWFFNHNCFYFDLFIFNKLFFKFRLFLLKIGLREKKDMRTYNLMLRVSAYFLLKIYMYSP